MNARRNNHGAFDEGALTDLIESGADLSGLPAGIRARLERLRVDRRTLCGLGELRAPAGLVAAAQRAAERRALLEMEGAAEASLAVSTVPRPHRPSILQSILADRFARRFALAAGLALVAGAAVLAVRQAGVRGGPTVATSPVESGGTGAAPRITEPAPEVVAKNLDRNTDPQAPAETIAAAAQAQDAPPAPEAMALSQALALAREGRLALRIRAADAEKAELRLDRLAYRGRGEEGWRVAGVLPEGAAITLRYVTPALPEPEGPPAMADDGRGARSLTVDLPRQDPVAVPARPAGTVYMAEVRLDESSLALLLAECGVLSGQEAWFDELDSPPPAAAPALALDAVVWWGLPASAWEAWGRVPVSVERP